MQRKIVGILFLIVGLVFAMLGVLKYANVLVEEKDDRIYTVARIIQIDSRETGDPEHPVAYTAYVEFDGKGEGHVAQLNVYRSDFQIGKSLEIYYYEDAMSTVYIEGSDGFYLLFAAVGLAFALLGTALVARKSENRVEK